jgi:hypothetical protein
MFEQVSNAVGTLATLHGAFVACSEIGSQLVVATDGTQLTDVNPKMKGDPTPGVLVCDTGSAIAGKFPAAKAYCGLGEGLAQLAPWKFVSLTVAAGPVDSAIANVAAGTICLKVGARSFTYSTATSSVTEGCG